MKNLLLLGVAIVVMLSSCDKSTQPKQQVLSNYKSVRAIDAITKIPAAIQIPRDTSIYRAGDTIWVSTRTMRVSNITWLKRETPDFRLFVLQK